MDQVLRVDLIDHNMSRYYHHRNVGQREIKLYLKKNHLDNLSKNSCSFIASLCDDNGRSWVRVTCSSLLYLPSIVGFLYNISRRFKMFRRIPHHQIRHVSQ